SGEIGAPAGHDATAAEAPLRPAASLAPPAAETHDAIQAALQLGAALPLAAATACRWRALADALCTLPEVDAVVVFAVDESTERLVPHVATGTHASALGEFAIPVGERVSGWVAGMEQSMINADATLDLFDTEAGALSSAAAFPCRCDESRFVVSLYSERKAAFGA